MVVHWASKLVDLVSNAVLLSLYLLRLELLTQVPRNVFFIFLLEVNPLDVSSAKILM